MYTGTTLHLNKSSSANDIMNYLKDGLAVGDYYQEKGQTFGNWHGKLAPVLGFEKDVNFTGQKEAFVNLLQGKHPATGQLIKAHKARSNGVAGYDFVVNPDKSVSVMAMFDNRILDAHQKANELALKEIEKNASRRMRTGPQHNRIELPNKFTGNMLCCSFMHDLSRANDPQIHTHNFIFNLTMDEDGNFYSLDQKEMKLSIRYFSHIYNSILAKELQKLGYKIDPVKQKGRIVSFRLADVSKEICDTYSSRRQDILLEAEVYKKEKNLDRALSPAEREIIARATRANKKILTEREKISYARSKVKAEDWAGLEKVHKQALKAKVKEPKFYFKKEVNLAIEHLFERKSAVALREIYSEVMVQNFGKVNYYDLKQYVENHLEKHKLMDLAMNSDRPMAESYVTTQRSLEREAYSIHTVNKGIEKCRPFNEEYEPFNSPEVLEYEKKNHINFDDQRSLLKDLLVSRDRYINVRGKAGTGKSTMLKELQTAVNWLPNQAAMFIAPTNAAVDALNENNLNAMTVARFLLSCHRHRDIKNLTVVVDEAGLLSSKQGAQLLYIAEKYNWRIIFSGDSRQHSSVEAGDFIRGLEEYSKILTLDLSTINRQQVKYYKEIVELLSDNKTKEGLELLDKHKGITERSDYLRSAVESFEEKDFTAPGKCLYVAPTNREVEALNIQIRERVKSFGKDYLANEVDKTIFIQSNMTVARSKLAGNYSPGDYIQINRRFQKFRRGEYHRVKSIDRNKNRIILENGSKVNLDNHFADILHGTQRTIKVGQGEKIICTARDKAHDLFNGEVLTIQDMHCRVDGEDFIKCTNSNGKVKFMPRDFRHFKYAYAVTSHRSQGTTVDKVVVAAETLHSESAYVALSRGRKSCHIYTPNKYDLINNAMEYSRPLALDIINKEDKRYHLEFISPARESRRITTELGKEQRARDYELYERQASQEKERRTKVPEREISPAPELTGQQPEHLPEKEEIEKEPEIVTPPEIPVKPPERVSEPEKVDNRDYIREHIKCIREKEQQVRQELKEVEFELKESRAKYEEIRDRTHKVSSEIWHLEQDIPMKQRIWDAQQNSFLNKINPFKDTVAELKFEREMREAREKLEKLRKEYETLPKQEREALADVQSKENHLRSGHWDDVYGFDLGNFDENIESLKHGEIFGSFVPFLNNLNGITRIQGNVDFSKTDFTNLGDVREITGKAVFSRSKIRSLEKLEHAGELSLNYSRVDDIGNLKTVKRNVYSNDEILLNKWLEVDIGNKLFIGDRDVSKQYYHARGQDHKYEKIRDKENDLYHSRDIGFGR